ncbi:MAG: hypothetical protein AAAC48_01855 [Phyllobacterium sp.]|uniref:hypothetical protein n=1 Tax=Phyllobacterium sp. TaxID=1871046 RepID=UPI0030F17AB6
MSNCCGNPGVGDKLETGNNPLPVYDTYNPGEVRLYGRPALNRPIFPLSDAEIIDKLKVELEKFDFIGGNADNVANSAFKPMLDQISNATAAAFGERVTLAVFDNGNYQILPVTTNKYPVADSCIKSIGVIYGYAYEGHCYKLPRPQIMYLPSDPKEITGDKCACDCGYSAALGYAVWQVDKLDRVVALDVRSDDIKTLVLDANMPGNRSPLAYSQTLALAPQRSHE